MFDRLKKAFAKEPAAAADAPPAVDPGSFQAVQSWAASQHLAYGPQANGFSLAGQVSGRPWRIETGRSGRKYIAGDELRGRAELGLRGEVLVVLMNRALKEQLEKQAYQLYTDTLQTSVDASLPEEMRLLAMHPEAMWDGPPREFWARYAVVAEDREHAQAWVDPVLAKLLLAWPVPAPDADVPFMLMLLRGKAYLRMQQGPLHLPTLQHVVQVFTSASENALGAFPG